MNDALMDRFVDRVVVTETCWLWTGRKDGKGYATLHPTKGVILKAHTLAYEHFVGQIPEGLCLDHLCRVRHCVNPRHLEPVTLVENVMRGESPHARNARKTHCVNGHPFNETNTRYDHGGWRQCRTCDRARARRYREEKRCPPSD